MRAMGKALAAAIVVAIGTVAGVGLAGSGKPQIDPGIHKIKHVVVIMQENRSFDSYFGTYPGAAGLPKNVCVPDPATGSCVRPYHDPNDVNSGGPHGQTNATADIDGGKMDGFIGQAEKGKKGCADPNNPTCAGRTVDVMGYHDSREIPNYWAYARSFVLQDHMFEPNASWSLPAHLFMVSEWSATCSVKDVASSCRSAANHPAEPPDFRGDLKRTTPSYAWTDLTYLLHENKVSWRYYVAKGMQPDCVVDAATICSPPPQCATMQVIWNPIPFCTTVK